MNDTLYSIQFANNEIGTIQDIKKISEIVRKYNGILHTDATQMIPNNPVNVKDLSIDMMSFSGQKLGATKRIGVLYVKHGVELEPIIYGSQEKSRRGGTEMCHISQDCQRQLKLFTTQQVKYVAIFLAELQNKLDDIYVVGDMKHRLNNNLSVCFKGIEAESLLLLLDNKDIYVSSGSACISASLSPSYVLQAIGMKEPDINSVIRFSFGENTTERQCDIAVDEIVKSVKLLRKMNM